MNRIKLIYTLLIAAIIPLLTACSSDDLANNSDDSTQQQGEKVTVRFRVSQAGTNTMRAWKDTSEDVKEEEMMNIWTVIAVENESNNVVGIWSCKPQNSEEKEIDEVGEFTVDGLFTRGDNYRFYSFANMDATYLEGLLGFSRNVIPTPNADGNVEANTDNLNECKLTEQQVKDITVLVQGNGFDVNKADNGFGAKGIPMSNVQTFTKLQAGEKDLIVIRMLAKIKLQLYNDSGDDITINSITLTNLTANEGGDNYKNIKLLPKLTLTNGENTMESTEGYHADIQPNLNETPPQAEYIYIPSEKKIDKTDNTSEKEPVEYIFYVNESENPQGDYYSSSDQFAPTTPQQFMHYFLKINLQSGSRTSEVRYTLIDNNKLANTDDKWNYIARNDYRIIPIVLDDYKLDMIPYDFPAIGVLPASVKEEDGIYTINFHDYGHFHLVPKVTKYSSPSVVVPYSKTAKGDTYWNLGVDDESSQLLSGVLTTRGVWGAWIDASKDKNYVNNEISTSNDTKYSDFNKIAFYRTGYNPTTIEDGDEVGGEPVWYLNAERTPQWSPNANATDYPPFIFGYIADPFPNGTQTDELKKDRKVYHEFTINLHKANASPAIRQMTYRLYMILDTKQMLYRGDGSGSTNGAPRVRHPHCLH